MKINFFLLYTIIAAVVFNLRFFQVDIGERVKAEGFLTLCFITVGLFWAYAKWISSRYFYVLGASYDIATRIGVVSISKKSKAHYILQAIVPILLFHYCAIWCIASVGDDTEMIIEDYMVGYFPMLGILVVGYVILLLFRPEYALLANPVKTVITTTKQGKGVSDSVDRKAHLYALFHHLKASGGIGPVLLNKAVRFFDIVFIETHSKVRYVILSNGERMLCDSVLGHLRERGMDRWMIKISKNYYINMMLVLYPMLTPNKELSLQPDVYTLMLEKLSPAEIGKMCKIGAGMKNNLVEDFLASQNSMDYTGWDTFIPLR